MKFKRLWIWYVRLGGFAAMIFIPLLALWVIGMAYGFKFIAEWTLVEGGFHQVTFSIAWAILSFGSLISFVIMWATSSDNSYYFQRWENQVQQWQLDQDRIKASGGSGKHGAKSTADMRSTMQSD